MGYGTIEATEVEVSAKIPGRIEALNVVEGQRVHRGDVIATLDRREIDAQAEQARAGVEAAQARLADVERGSRVEQIRSARAALAQAEATVIGARNQIENAEKNYARATELKQQVDAARAQLASLTAGQEAAEQRLREAINGPRPEQIAQARAALEQAAAAVQGAGKDLVHARTLLADRMSLQREVDEAVTAREVALARLRAAEEDLSLVQEGARREQRDRARASITQAGATLEASQLRYQRLVAILPEDAVSRQDVDDAESKYIAAKAGVEIAQSALDEMEDGARPQEIARAQQAVAQARAEVEGREKGLDSAKIIVHQLRTQAQQVLDAAEARLEQLKSARDAAQSALDLLLAGTREEQVAQAEAALRQAEAQVKGAEAGLRNAQILYSDRILAKQQLDTAHTQLATALAQRQAAAAQLDLLVAGNTREAIALARAQLEQAQAGLAQAREVQANCTVVAPTDGTVSDVPVEAGEVLAPGAPIAVILDLQNLWVKIYLPLTDFGRARRGQQAVVTSDAVPGQEFAGEVIAVSDEAEFTPKNIQTREQRVNEVFWVKVGLGAASGLLKPGMPAEARFVSTDEHR